MKKNKIYKNWWFRVTIGIILLFLLFQLYSQDYEPRCVGMPDGELCTWPNDVGITKRYNGPVYLGMCYKEECLKRDDYEKIKNETNK